MRFYCFLLIIAIMGFCCLGAGKKAPAVSVRFYVMAAPQDTDTSRLSLCLENAPSEVNVQKRPVLSERDIVAFYPFAAHDGSLGVYFQLDMRGSETLKNLTTMRQSSYLIAVIDRQPICMLLIDRPVTDGLIVIPNGINKDQRFRLGQQLPIINETPAQAKQRREQEQIRDDER